MRRPDRKPLAMADAERRNGKSPGAGAPGSSFHDHDGRRWEEEHRTRIGIAAVVSNEPVNREDEVGLPVRPIPQYPDCNPSRRKTLSLFCYGPCQIRTVDAARRHARHCGKCPNGVQAATLNPTAKARNCRLFEAARGVSAVDNKSCELLRSRATAAITIAITFMQQRGVPSVPGLPTRRRSP